MMETPGSRQRFITLQTGFGLGLAIGWAAWGSLVQCFGESLPPGDDPAAAVRSDVPPNPLRRSAAGEAAATGPVIGRPPHSDLPEVTSEDHGRSDVAEGDPTDAAVPLGRWVARGKVVIPTADRWLIVCANQSEASSPQQPMVDASTPARSAAEVTADLMRQTTLPFRVGSKPLAVKDESKSSQPVLSFGGPAASEPRSSALRIGFQLQDNSDAPAVGREQSSPPALTAAQQRLKLPLQKTLAYYLANPETTSARSPWAVMHAALPFSADAELLAGNRRVNAIGWLCQNGQLRGQRIFSPARSGFVVNVGAGVQGHEGQLLAILAQCRIPDDFPIRVGSFEGTVADIVRYEMLGCRPRTELTFRLIGLSHYLPADESWLSDDRQRWTIERLVQEELAQPIVGAACGGTHRLMGLTYALRRRQEAGLPNVGHFSRAAQFIDDFVDYAWTLQNPDGSFSTNWFESRGNKSDPQRKVQTTGHVAEWLVFTLPDDQLADPRLIRSLELLVSQLYDRRDQDWPIGPRGHAIRALALYEQRVYGGRLGERHQQLARLIEQSQTRR